MAGAVAKRVNATTLVLTHFSSRYSHKTALETSGEDVKNTLETSGEDTSSPLETGGELVSFELLRREAIDTFCSNNVIIAEDFSSLSGEKFNVVKYGERKHTRNE